MPTLDHRGKHLSEWLQWEKKMRANESNFMTEANVRESMSEIKLKNSEGVGSIPQRILVDGIEAILKPMAVINT